MATYLIRCHELGRDTQSGRRKLQRDLAAVIDERFPGATIAYAPGRLVVEATAGLAGEIAALPGVDSVSPCVRVGPDEVERAVVELARSRLGPEASFAVRVRRRGDAAGERSPELARRLGDAVATATGARIDLEHPDIAIGVEVRDDGAFVFDRALDGIDRTGPPAPRAPGEPRFLADQMLGRLAARLRLLGYDTVTVYDLADSEVTRLAAAGGRILLTRDSGLARTRAVPVYRVAATEPRAQLVEVVEALSLAPDPARYFSRCTLCNTPIEPAEEASLGDRVPPGIRGRELELFQCPACEHVYWHGSHVDRILAELDAAGVRARR